MRVAPNALYILQKLMHGPDVVRARLKMNDDDDDPVVPPPPPRPSDPNTNWEAGRPVVLFGC